MVKAITAHVFQHGHPKIFTDGEVQLSFPKEKKTDRITSLKFYPFEFCPINHKNFITIDTLTCVVAQNQYFLLPDCICTDGERKSNKNIFGIVQRQCGCH